MAAKSHLHIPEQTYTYPQIGTNENSTTQSFNKLMLSGNQEGRSETRRWTDSGEKNHLHIFALTFYDKKPNAGILVKADCIMA